MGACNDVRYGSVCFRAQPSLAATHTRGGGPRSRSRLRLRRQPPKPAAPPQCVMAPSMSRERFARPTTSVLFSRGAIIGPYSNGQDLMFRIVNRRRNEIIDLEAQVLYSAVEPDHHGGTVRRYSLLPLERNKVTFFLSALVVPRRRNRVERAIPVNVSASRSPLTCLRGHHESARDRAGLEPGAAGANASMARRCASRGRAERYVYGLPGRLGSKVLLFRR